MSRPHLRPHFDVEVSAPPEAVLARLKEHFQTGQARFSGHIVDRHVQLVLRSHARNPWTPWLTFEVLDRHEGGSTLTGRFAPHPSGWTLYLALYGMVGITGLGLGFFGVSQWLAGLPADMLWAFPISLLVMGLLYVSAFVGQTFTGPDMEAMRSFVMAGLEPPPDGTLSGEA